LSFHARASSRKAGGQHGFIDGGRAQAPDVLCNRNPRPSVQVLRYRSSCLFVPCAFV
jgi:hypothetical protein